MMEYKGYIGKAEFDDEANIFHGEVINIRDVVTFQGKSVTALRKAFKDSVDDYLDFCKERNESPDKPFSGKLMLRLNPEQHRKIFIHSRLEGKSLNTWIADALDQVIEDHI
jgi:predicted HicB family RNase H-like nuclease